MTELFAALQDPAYRHVLSNHLPVTGLFVAWLVLLVGVVSRQRPTVVLGLALVGVMAGSAVVVMPAGEDAYPTVYEALDGASKERLDAHADLAAKWGLTLYLAAGLAVLALAAAVTNRRFAGAASWAALISALGSLVAAVWIADAGGKIRHPEFRNAHAGAGAGEDAVGGPVAMRRLSAEQYRRAIADAFGDDVEVVGRFEPEARRDGLLAVGSAQMTITPSGLEQYEAMATSIAGQLVAPARRDRLPCRPLSADGADAACTEEFVRSAGARLFRRELTTDEIRSRVEAASAAAASAGDFYVGLELAATTLLAAPEFLFRIERVEPDPARADRLRLSPDTVASRLSYLVWNAAPDDELREAADRGGLLGPDELARQVDRLLASPRAEDGVRAFFADVLRFDEIDMMSKDIGRYPIYSSRVALDAREQSLKVIVDHLVTRNEDYRDLFTTRRSFVTRRLGPLYGVPVRAADGWEEIEFPEGHVRAGLLTHASLNMLHAHPGRSSPTLRGQFLRESILCQTVPPAPADVEFALFNDDQNPEHKTARDRLEVHSSAGSCRSCHQLTDPIGLGLEHFDGIGKFRTTENGAPIDASGDLDGDTFRNASELGRAFRNHPRLAPCLVENLYRYAVGREIAETERGLTRRLVEDFRAAGYRVPALLRAIALSEAFRTAPLSSAVEPVVEEDARSTRAMGRMKRSEDDDA